MHFSGPYTWLPKVLDDLNKRFKKLEGEDAKIQALQYYKNLARARAHADYLWGVIRGTSLPSEEKEIAYKTFCDLSDSEQVDYSWGVIRGTNLHTEVKELVYKYNTLWDMESWTIQPTLLVQPFIVPSTPPIRSTPTAQYLPIQSASLVQATPPILSPPIQLVLVQPLIVPSTSPIRSTPPAQYLPIQPSSLVQATPPILPPARSVGIESSRKVRLF